MNEYAYLEDPENNLAVKKGKLIEEKLDQLIKKYNKGST